MDLICKSVEFGGSTGYLVLPQDSDDPIVQDYLNGGNANDYMLTALAETTVPGDIVLDIGCHVGTFSVGAALLGRSVLSADANPLHTDLVRKSYAVNGLEGAVLHKAISSSRGPVTFIADGLFGRIDYVGDSGEKFGVETIGLDELAATHAKGKVRFLKMDIEGAELQAFQTGERLLRDDAPVIWWESNGPTLALAGTTIREVREWLEDRGYKTFRIEGERWVYAPPSQVQPEAWLDVISISVADQERWKDRIDWEWDERTMIGRCEQWLDQRHPHTLKHLLVELSRLPQSEAKEIAQKAERSLADLTA